MSYKTYFRNRIDNIETLLVAILVVGWFSWVGWALLVPGSKEFVDFKIWISQQLYWQVFVMAGWSVVLVLAIKEGWKKVTKLTQLLVIGGIVIIGIVVSGFLL